MQISFLDGIWVMLGGGIGALLRWISTYMAITLVGKSWPATLFVNVLGSLILILVSKYYFGSVKVLNPLVKIGILGSLTTFSTFSYELFVVLKDSNYYEAGLIFSLNILFGIFIWVWIIR